MLICTMSNFCFIVLTHILFDIYRINLNCLAFLITFSENSFEKGKMEGSSMTKLIHDIYCFIIRMKFTLGYVL